MNRKEKLLKKLKDLKVKLEVRKKRFELWQDEIERKDELGKATIEELEKSQRYWIKSERLGDRIQLVNSKIYDIESRSAKDEEVNYWMAKFDEVIASIRR